MTATVLYAISQFVQKMNKKTQNNEAEHKIPDQFDTKFHQLIALRDCIHLARADNAFGLTANALFSIQYTKRKTKEPACDDNWNMARQTVEEFRR